MSVIDHSEIIDKARQIVDSHYQKLVDSGEILLRKQQIDLSKQIAISLIKSVMGDDHLKEVLISEAPTGTGKSIAYLVGALAAHEALPSKIQVVAATATKALQAQLISKDVPKLVNAGIIPIHQVGIAKGKSNYICLKRANETLDVLRKFEENPAETLLDDNSFVLDSEQVDTLLDSYEKHLWDGDFDNFLQFKLKSTKAINVSSDSCNYKQCPHARECAYYGSMDDLDKCKVIITNHDLILRDLQLHTEGGESNLGKKVKDYLLVVDEAHNFPDKAIAVGQTEGKLTFFYEALPKLKGAIKLVEMSEYLKNRFTEKGIMYQKEWVRTHIDNPLLDLAELFNDLELDSESNHRFKLNNIPMIIKNAMLDLKLPLQDLNSSLEESIATLADIPPMEYMKNSVIITDLSRRLTDVKNLSVTLLRALSDCLNEYSETAKWVHKHNDKIILMTSPVEGAEVLNPLLWHPEDSDVQSKVKGVSLISATLRDVNGFNRIASKLGIDFEFVHAVLPYIFPYRESTLKVVGMKHTPKFSERAFFEAELATKLPNNLNPDLGTLIIFHSWGMLNKMRPIIEKEIGTWCKILVQGDAPIKALIEEHCRTIDAGEGSLLMGVASMAEGLDLPGKYCEHVHIPVLPFASPSDPVEQEVSDRLGSAYFSQRSLPDATTNLIQGVGRLLRREEDRGTVFIYDRRLVASNYGYKMMAALPPFKRIIEPVY